MMEIMNNSKYLEEAFLASQQVKNRLLEIIYEEDLRPHQIDFPTAITESTISQKEFQVHLDNQWKFLYQIYENRFLKQYGEITTKAAEFYLYPQKSILVTSALISKRFLVTYIIVTTAFFKLKDQRFIPSGYYVFMSKKGSVVEEIEEGTDETRYSQSDKFGFLLNSMARKDRLNTLKLNKLTFLEKIRGNL